MQEQIEPKLLGIRKKIEIIIENEKNCLIIVSQKSRILRKDVSIFEDIFLKVKEYKKLTLSKSIKIDGPLCSKAKLELEQNGWEVI
jgi:hypothetical protein